MHGKAKESAEIDSEKEMISLATVQAMKKDKVGNITVDGLQQELEGEATVEQIRKKIVITVNDSQRMYYVDDNGNVYEFVYTDLPMMEYGDIFNNRMADYRASILTVTVLDNINIPENTYQVFDISKEQDGTVKAWLVPNEENTAMYDLYISGEEGVEVESCQNMFQNFSECISVNLEYLCTEKVISFQNMFYNDQKLVELRTSADFVCDSAKNLRYMFYLCTKLKNIDTSQWNTSNVTDMFGTFRMCQSIEILDLSSWSISNVTATDYLFQYCKKLKTIYVSESWSNSKVSSSENMFQGCSALKGAVSFDASNANDITCANYETGYFTYKKVSEI